MIKLRTVKISDWDKLKNLLQDLIEEKPPVAIELEPLLMKGDLWLAQFPKGKLGHFIVATYQGTIVGFCYVAVPIYYRPIAYIGIAIKKNYRKTGIGSQMFYEVAQWAAGNDIQYIIADVWEWNEKSLKFFEHLGFTEKSRFDEKFNGELKKKVRMVRRI
jgi:RimJ/RimL family protein N-acetyltransferase